MPKQITIIVSRCASCPKCWAGCECTAIGDSRDDYREITVQEYESPATPSWCPLPDANESQVANEDAG